MKTLFINQVILQLKGSGPFKVASDRLRHGGAPLEFEGVDGGFRNILIHSLHTAQKNPFVVVFPGQRELEEARHDWALFGENHLEFSDWNTLPYSGNSPQAKCRGMRVHTLVALLGGEKRLVSTTLGGLLLPLPPPDWLRERTISMKVGEILDPFEIGETLSMNGYERVPQVELPGEFAVRGEVVDIFPSGAEEPVRIVFCFNSIETIKTFSSRLQSTTMGIDSISIPPVRESIWSSQRLEGLEKWLSQRGECSEAGSLILDTLSQRGSCPNDELLFPFSFPNPATLLDYLPKATPLLFVAYEHTKIAAERGRREAYELFGQLPDGERSCLPRPEELLLELDEMEKRSEKLIRFLEIKDGEKRGRLSFNYEGPRSFFGNISYLKEELSGLSEAGYRIGIFAESESQATRLKTLLSDLEVEVIPHGISQGMTLPDLKLVLIQENEIFRRKRQTRHSLHTAKSDIIESFVELNPGDLVVHINNGIGRFVGIERVMATGTERDYIKLEYADEEMVFIPVEQANMVQRYIGSGGAEVALDRLGGRGWSKRKGRVRKSVEELADHLVQLYSKRKLVQGFAFPGDTDWQLEFEASFPYEETQDQLRAILEVKEDMESPKPMDRLICGDVGFGKTEVAMRAAFKAVVGGRQVAMLVPTTILAEQHYEKFIERFAQFPVKIGMLSRFVPPKEIRKKLEEVSLGEVDIVIGTHRLLQKDVEFYNLGLIVVDEEQRFGVKHKERLKELKHSVDSLTLSATPIPRTLQMSLLKIRDISLLTTAPSSRMAIETFIREFDQEVVAQAIRKEVSRGGQVFYLHNRIETLEATELMIRELVPEVFVRAAHGRMNSQELEEVMYGFVHHSFQVLITTTIIENGIDIPNVNTIIIDRADLYGISQLYQLRGRVGRSDRQAYAYLLYPYQSVLTELAMKRLHIVSDFTELGAGFKIALKDLEVRGAGNLLGREQSGDVISVGLDMYMRLLDEAIARRTESGTDEDSPLSDPYMELEYSGFIPDSYVSSSMEKMEVYKSIASIRREEDMLRITAELGDKYGPLPDEVSSLLALAEIRTICNRLRISTLKEREGRVVVEFGRISIISVDKVIRLISEGGGRISLDARRPNILILETGSIGLREKAEFLRERLSRLI